MPMTPLILPGLLDRETAYTLGTGDTIVVTTTRYTPPGSPDVLTLQVDTDVVDPLTLTTIATLPSHPWSIQKAALAEAGALEQQIALAHDKAGELALAWRAAVQAAAAVTETPAPGVPVTRNRAAP